MVDESEKVVMEGPPQIPYPPLQRNVKLEIPEEIPEQQEVNTVKEEDWTLELSEDSDMAADPSPPAMIAYRPLKWHIKLEDLDGHHEENNFKEENLNLLVRKDDLVASTCNTPIILDLPIANASLPSEETGQSKERLRDHQTAMNAFKKGGALLDSELMEELGSEEEDSECHNGSERSEHSSLEGFDESANSITSDTNDDEESNSTAPKKRFKCSKCERSYQLKSSLAFHLKNECGTEPRFPCDQCQSKFSRKDRLQKHLINFHKVHREQLDKHGAGSMEKSFKCTKCDKSYKQKRSLNQHTKNECGVSFSCTLCQQNLATKCSLRTHLRIVHNIVRRQLDQYGVGYKVLPVSPFKCDQCGRTFKQKRDLARHLLIVCGVEPSVPCPQCNKQFKRKAELQLHLLEIHNVERSQLAAYGLGPVVRPEYQFKCGQCGASYKRKQHLNRHLANKCGKTPL